MLTGGKNTKFILVLVLSMVLAAPACKSGSKVPKEVKQAEKADARMQKEAEKEYEEAVKRHYKMQSEQSKKIMKEMKKSAKKKNKLHRRSLWDRIFHNSCK